MQIVHKITGRVLSEYNTKSIKECLVNALSNGANLRSADLKGADLGSADLEGANLGSADLEGANLWGADLKGANLKGANLKGSGLFQMVGFGEMGRCVTIDTLNQKVIAGCFYNKYEQFMQAISDKYKDSPKGKAYILAFKGMLSAIEIHNS